jgi:hypothetical protein
VAVSVVLGSRDSCDDAAAGDACGDAAAADVRGATDGDGGAASGARGNGRIALEGAARDALRDAFPSGSPADSALAVGRADDGGIGAFASDALAAARTVAVRRVEGARLAGTVPASATGVVLARGRRGAADFARTGAASAASSAKDASRGAAARRRTGFSGVAAVAFAAGSAAGLRRRVGFGRSVSSIFRV